MPEPVPSIVDGETRFLPRAGWQELFELRARRYPLRTALVAGDVAWSFGEVDQWSGRLATVLREAGARPGAVVACVMSRSVQAVLAPLAVGKAGAVYLPLDPALPPARLSLILAEADPVVVLTDVESLAACADILLTAENWLDVLIGCEEHTGRGGTADDPAYLVYTSGSTGGPKGVVVGHRSLVNLYCELAARLFPTASGPQRVAHGMPLGFDAAWDPLLWMAGGHQLHLVPEDVRADPEQYVRFARARRLSVLEAVPAHLSALLDAGLLEGEQHPELLLMGGEGIGQALWSRLRAARGVTAVNLYGPTECTVFTTSCALGERDTPAIGRPIANTRAQVVDAALRPVPVGEPGELLVGGTCLAMRYLGDPVLTGARFGTGTQRWYRTGDRARVCPDGALEWLGRLDQQVKIRGHRVEPGETEHALLALPGVRQAAVRAEGHGDRLHLAAYVVLDSGTSEEVGDRLRSILPEHLLPSTVVSMDALPLGPNGKVDRAALPLHRATPGAVLTPAQEVIAAAFRAQLGIRTVSPDSDFFALGGHSLTAAALAARLRAHGIPCSLRDVLRRRTVARLAELVHQGETS